jgi:LuxR family transcriptional regulator, quorum-sensing system regulator SolR
VYTRDTTWPRHKHKWSGVEVSVRAWQDDQLQILLSEQDEHRVFDKLVDIARQLGFDHCAYGLRLPLPLSRQRVVMFKNYAAGSSGQYPQGLQHVLKSQPPVIWDDEYCIDDQELSGEVRESGLRYSWAQPCRDAQGALSMFTVARSDQTH